MINGIILTVMIWAFVSVIALAGYNPNMDVDRTNPTSTDTETGDEQPNN